MLLPFLIFFVFFFPGPKGFTEGYFVQPTVFADVNNQMTIAQEEIFGPVLAIIPYQTEAEAIDIANDTIYGLNNGVASADMDKAMATSSYVMPDFTLGTDGAYTDRSADKDDDASLRLAMLMQSLDGVVQDNIIPEVVDIIPELTAISMEIKHAL